MRPVDKLIDRLENVSRSGNSGAQWTASCPGPNHNDGEDSRPSLSFGELKDGIAVMKCFAGCSAESILHQIGLTFADLYPENNSNKPPKPPVTIGLLAWDKRLPVDLLKSFGLENIDGGGVEIPYADVPVRRFARAFAKPWLPRMVRCGVSPKIRS